MDSLITTLKITNKKRLKKRVKLDKKCLEIFSYSKYIRIACSLLRGNETF